MVERRALAARASTAPAQGRSAPATAPGGTATSAPRAFAVVGARVFDGERTLAKATVVVREGLIEAVGPDIAVPADAERVDGAGRTLLPGLIDAHTHAFGNALERALQFGVTTELDMFTDHRLAARLRTEQAGPGGAPGRADLRSAGTLVTVAGGHGTEYAVRVPTLAGAADAAAFVDARLAEGSDYIKAVYDDGTVYGLKFPTLDRETLAAVIAAAHARQKLAVVHVGQYAAARTAIEAGADGLAHVFADRDADADFATLVARRGAFVVPTLTVVESTTGVPSGAPVAEDPRLAGTCWRVRGRACGRPFRGERGARATSRSAAAPSKRSTPPACPSWREATRPIRGRPMGEPPPRDRAPGRGGTDPRTGAGGRDVGAGTRLPADRPRQNRGGTARGPRARRW